MVAVPTRRQPQQRTLHTITSGRLLPCRMCAPSDCSMEGGANSFMGAVLRGGETDGEHTPTKRAQPRAHAQKLVHMPHTQCPRMWNRS